MGGKLVNFLEKVDEQVDGYEGGGNSDEVADILSQELAIEKYHSIFLSARQVE